MSDVILKIDFPKLVDLAIAERLDPVFSSAEEVQYKILDLLVELWNERIPGGISPRIEYWVGDSRNVVSIEIKPLRSEVLPDLTGFIDILMQRIGKTYNNKLLFSVAIVLPGYRDEYVYYT